ncbi:hypothetical protein HDU81_008127 [Chytriomyces hyalinus]|nr:hypothetical protein HDU81_008127 [Chytriomyces hyalinus]
MDHSAETKQSTVVQVMLAGHNSECIPLGEPKQSSSDPHKYNTGLICVLLALLVSGPLLLSLSLGHQTPFDALYRDSLWVRMELRVVRVGVETDSI